MTLDPWKPPSGWDRVTPEPNQGPWTVGRVLRTMGRAFRKQPFGVLLAVCILPGLWAVPAAIVQARYVSEDEPFFGPGRSLLAAAVSIGSDAWGSVWFAGQLHASIAAVRGHPIQWRAFLTGLLQAPLLFLSFAAVAVPFELVSLLPITVQRGELFSAFDAVGLLLMMYLGARTCLWAPLLVDARVPFFQGLMESWVITSGAVTRLVLMAVIFSVATAPILFLEASFTNRVHVFAAIVSALYAMAVAAIYTFVYPEPVTPSSSLEP